MTVPLNKLLSRLLKCSNFIFLSDFCNSNPYPLCPDITFQLNDNNQPNSKPIRLHFDRSANPGQVFMTRRHNRALVGIRGWHLGANDAEDNLIITCPPDCPPHVAVRQLYEFVSFLHFCIPLIYVFQTFS